MRWFGRFLGRVLLWTGGVAALLWYFGPYEPVELDVAFDESQLSGGVDAYFARAEGLFDDIVPGTQKRVIWAGAPEQSTPVSVLYVHGFSATSEEIRPVPDEIAAALGANLVYTRLSGHGRGSAAMAEPQARDWMLDVAEGLAAARAAGDRVVVISTSTGGSLMAMAELNPVMMRGVAAQIFVSPNFGINSAAAFLLTLPGVRYWAPLVAGKERSFEPRSADYARYWTTSYPTVAVLPMAALVAHVQAQDWGRATTPALFWYSREDQVVSPERTDQIAAAWGGGSSVVHPVMGPGDDPYSHVVSGAIASPGQTQNTVKGMLAWLKEQGIQ